MRHGLNGRRGELGEVETTALFQTFIGWKSSEGPRRGNGCMVQRADAKGVRRCCIRIKIASSPRLVKVVIVAYVVSLRFFSFFRSAWSLPSPFSQLGLVLPFNWVLSSLQLGLVLPFIWVSSFPSTGSYLPFNWVSSFPFLN